MCLPTRVLLLNSLVFYYSIAKQDCLQFKILLISSNNSVNNNILDRLQYEHDGQLLVFHYFFLFKNYFFFLVLRHEISESSIAFL